MVAFDTITAASGAASTATVFDTITAASGAATVAAVMSVSLGADRGGIEPYTYVDLHATVTNGVGAVLTLAQTGGVTAGITGSAPDWTYQAPAVLVEEGAHLIFTVTAELGGDVAQADVDHFVYPHTMGFLNAAGQMVPARLTDNASDTPQATAPFPDAGLFPDTGVRLRS
jgi:hypothetical protein